MLHVGLFKISTKVKIDFSQLKWRCRKKVWRWRENLSNFKEEDGQ